MILCTYHIESDSSAWSAQFSPRKAHGPLSLVLEVSAQIALAGETPVDHPRTTSLSGLAHSLCVSLSWVHFSEDLPSLGVPLYVRLCVFLSQ